MKKGPFYIGGREIGPAAIVYINLMAVFGFGILVAIELGYIPDHAP